MKILLEHGYLVQQLQTMQSGLNMISKEMVMRSLFAACCAVATDAAAAPSPN